MLLPLDIQFFSDKTLYELKQAMATIGQQLKKVEGELSAKAIDPSASIEDIQAQQKSKEDLQARFNVIKQQHDELEAEQKAKFAQQQAMKQATIGHIEDPQQKVIAAKAELYRNTIRKQPISEEAMALLDDSTTGGNKFLPKTVSTQIITEPKAKNPLRGHSMHTQITNLEIPKLTYVLDDDDFIEDGATAKELKLTGDTVQFGRHKFKVKAEVSETVVNGTDVALVQSVDGALESGVAAKERKVAFATSPKAGEEHMSFYRTATATLPEIAKVQGATLFDAVTNAIADLHEDYRENAKVFMRFTDYLSIIKDLANGSATLFTAPPEQIIGKSVVFTDAAVKPVVGDFNYSHFNYDLNALYDTDKNISTGMHQFVVTAWFDHQIKLASAFRIAEVTPTP
ncbi:phage major capsid protein [Lysinibacillus sp. KU-BSD001]|uniref:phage major capsid protein n=1 Tax=Lysinibacillus sp. KU-BSD001 TaxID=3141328 RepID=UPI0036EB4B74